jgi:membrane fusion protein, multidrug efflux system
MKNKVITIVLFSLLVSCTAPSENGSELETKKKDLAAAQKEFTALKDKIYKLEKEISEADPAFAQQHNNAILVTTFIAEKKSFEHMVEIRGSVESRKNVLVAAQAVGEIQKVHVREGDRIVRGQVLVTLNADIIKNTITELRTALELANSVFERQAKLWDQKIGTEVQYLQAKNSKESLEAKLATANAQLELAIVRAPFNATVDQLPAREGEVASPGMPLIRLVSAEDIFVTADVSERFIGKFKAGDPVNIYFPAQKEKLASRISSVSQVINSENRTFSVEVELPKLSFMVKPNQLAVLELRDYISEETVAVPTRIIQRDELGPYVFVVDDRGNKMVARKVHVVTGVMASTETEILEGLSGKEQVVNEGYRELTEGVEVELADTTGKKKVVAKN